jgi:hypothetical protein
VDDVPGPLWVRVGGGLELVPTGERHGPADLGLPPPGGPWEPLVVNGRLVGFAREQSRNLGRTAEELGVRLTGERRAYLLGRLGHKLRSALLALQESARGAAFGRHEALEQVYEQAQEVGRRAAALEVAAIDPKDHARAVVLGAVLNLAAPAADRRLPGDAIVRAPESVLVEALTRAYEWMGGEGVRITGGRVEDWWRVSLAAAPERKPLAVPEFGEPLVRFLVDTHLQGWLDSADPEQANIYLPAYDVPGDS